MLASQIKEFGKPVFEPHLNYASIMSYGDAGAASGLPVGRLATLRVGGGGGREGGGRGRGG